MAKSVKLEERFDKEEVAVHNHLEQPLPGSYPGNRFSQIAKGLFGGHMTDEQTIGIVQLEVDKIKSIL